MIAEVLTVVIGKKHITFCEKRLFEAPVRLILIGAVGFHLHSVLGGSGEVVKRERVLRNGGIYLAQMDGPRLRSPGTGKQGKGRNSRQPPGKRKDAGTGQQRKS